SGKRRWLERGKEPIPDQVEHRLHILHAAGNGDDGVLLGQDDAVLPERAVAAESAVTTAPELVAVTLVPVASRTAAVRGLTCGGCLDPVRGNEDLVVPLPFLQVELTEPRDVFGADAQPVTTEADALGARPPRRVFDAERVEESRPQVI